jgi:hypothetical protein
MLHFDQTTFGIQEFELDLTLLYPTIEERNKFRLRFENFLQSDSFHQHIISLHGDFLRYLSEIFISNKEDERPPLLLLLGNPASHSVAAGMCFAFEKGGYEHRFWRILRETGVLEFNQQTSFNNDPTTRNEEKREALQELDYRSPFRIGIAVFYSLPSSASDPKWSGVNGVRKLFGKKALEKISACEEQRIGALLSKFMGDHGGILAFQKDAYNRIRSFDTPPYSRDLARRGLLLGQYTHFSQIYLAGSPPTRMMNSEDGKLALKQCKNWILKKFSSGFS